MKKTQLLDARRNIRKELVSYISIVIIGMLASLSYLGITYSAATLKKDALRFFNDYGLWDIEVVSTALLDEDDLEAIRAVPHVAEAEPVWQIDTSLRAGGKNTNVSIISLPDKISRPMLLEGRLPETSAECAVEKEIMDLCGFSVGQQIVPDCKPISGVDPLLEKSFVITGVFQTPDHITHMIPVTPYILVREESFNHEGLGGAFMKIHVRVEGTPQDRYSADYRNAVTPVAEAINAMAGERAELRREKLRANFDEKIGEGRQKLSDAEEQLTDGMRQLEEGRAEFESRRGELEDARQQLADGRREAEEGRKKLEDARRQLDEGWDALREAERQLDEAKDQLDRGGEVLAEAEYQLASVPDYVIRAVSILRGIEQVTGPISLPGSLGSELAQLEDGLRQYSDGRMLWYSKGEEYLDALTLYDGNLKKLEQGEEEYAEALAEYEDGLRQLEDGEKQLREGEAALQDAEKQLADAEKQLADGDAQYRDGEKELRDAEAVRDMLELGRWVVLDNKGNPGYIYAEANFDKLSSLSMSFSVIFLVVGALVIYATIARMVEQHCTIIGAVKAMGLYNREILGKYLYFACTATLLGVGLGLLVAWLPLQRTILKSYEKLLTYGEGTRSFLALQSGIVASGALTISVAAVYLGCSHLLRIPAIHLMQGSVSAGSGKGSGKSAQGNLYFHLIPRNMRTDLRRVLVTTVSIAGGCVLMVVGFTLLYGISGVPDRQFGRILTYEAEVFYDSAENPEASAEIEKILDENGLPHVGVRKASGVYEADGTLNALTVIVADKGTMDGYFALDSLDGQIRLELPDSGVLVPRRFSEYHGLNVGDSVTVHDADMNRREIRITGVFENFYGQLFFTSPQAYEEVFLSAPERNCFFVKTNGMELDTLREKLAGVAGLLNVNDAWAEKTVIGQFTSSLNLVVWLLLFIAGLMACFIVANFTMTYVQRKTRELTIMRVNGFTSRECTLYAAVDLIVTTILGTILGLVLGGFLGHAILSTTETSYIQMIRKPFLQSYLYSALITFGFSLLANSYALRRIKYLKLSDLT